MRAYFPLYADITGKRCVVVGGGAVGERKAADLLAAGARVCVVSPEVTPTLQEQAHSGILEWLSVGYAPEHLEGAHLVFAATSRREVNAQVTTEARARGCWVNVADAPEDSDFIVPTVVRRGELCLSVSTGGNNPLLARKVANALEAQFGPEYASLVTLLGQMRAYVKTRTSDSAQRRAALACLVEQEAELRALLQSGNEAEAQTLAERIVNGALSEP